MRHSNRNIYDWMVTLGCLNDGQLKRVLNEMKVSDLKGYNQDIPDEDFDRLVAASQSDSQKRKGLEGSNTRWLLGVYRNDPSVMSRLDGVEKMLRAFNPNNFGGKKLDELAKDDKQLGELLSGADNSKSENKEERFNRDIVFDQDGWMIISPTSHESSCYWAHIGTGNGAHPELGYEDGQWCTATPKNDSKYKEYIGKGPIYINIDKKNKRKYQFSFANDEFTDGENFRVDGYYPTVTIDGMPDSAVSWYRTNVEAEFSINHLPTTEEVKQLLANWTDLYDIFDDVDWFSDYLTRVKKYGKYNLIDESGEDFGRHKTKGNLLYDQWLDRIDDFDPDEGYAFVGIHGKYNVIDEHGKFLCKKWFDDFVSFDGEYAPIVLNGRANFIDRSGKLLYGDWEHTDQWFSSISPFVDGYAEVGIDGKKYKIDTQGNLHPRN